MDPMLSLRDHDPQSLAALLSQGGHNPMHARPVLRAFYRGCGRLDVESLRGSRAMKDWLRDGLTHRGPRVVQRHVSHDGTRKLLLVDDAGSYAVEAVLMPGYRDGQAAACVSSQVGCAMGCDFCASTRDGLRRNLSAGEIVDQYLALRAEAASIGRRLQTIVFMGMGEPMHNLAAVIAAIRRIADPDMGGLGRRRITVSTVGIVPGIDALADADLGVHLALSLHAPDDATRSRIVPPNRRWPVAEVMSAARRFASRTGRVPNIEYCLLAGVNDSDEQARLLAELMRGFRAHVNLIPYNAIGPGVSGVSYQRPEARRIERFEQILRENRVVTHVRAPRGQEIAAACGQLRSQLAPHTTPAERAT
jgi:23S rRNA (adenine2503-C2)-methyltransferase